MKAIQCELCGSNELVKDGDYYVCRYCGTRYTVEEARKLLFTEEGGVDVSGSTVKVDNSSYVERYLQNARRAKAKEDWAEVERYYNMVEQNEPTNIEAIFYSAYGKATQSLVDSDPYKREAAFKPFINSISIIDDNFDSDHADEQIELINQMSLDIFKMTSSSYVYNTRKNGYGIEVSNDSSTTVSLFARLHIGFIESVENIITVIPDDEPELIIDLCEIVIRHCDAKNVDNWKKKQHYQLKINSLDPTRYTKESEAIRKMREAEKEEELKKQRRKQWLVGHKLMLGGICIAALIAIIAVSAFVNVNRETLRNDIMNDLSSATSYVEQKTKAKTTIEFNADGTYTWIRTDNSNTKIASEGKGKYTIDASAKAIALTSALPIGEKSTTSTLYFENIDDTINSLTYGDATFLRRH